MKNNQRTHQNWLIKQKWEHVMFLTWFIDPELIRNKVPFELDLIEGKAAISIVPFKMSKIRFRGLPEIPFASALLELNIRTYVRVQNKPGIYFFTLDTDSFFGKILANQFFKLPYEYAKISAEFPLPDKSEYRFFSSRSEYQWKLNASIEEQITKKHETDLWMTERYHLFQKHRGKTLMGTVIHSPWNLKRASINEISGNFMDTIGIKTSTTPDHILYSSEIDVHFPSFVEISEG